MSMDPVSLSLNQLSQIRDGARKELSENEARYRSLASALAQYKDSLKSVNALGESEGDSLMVPMTGSLYMPGKLTDSSHVIVDIGTGFFVKKELSDAKEFLKRKISNLETFTEKLVESLLAQGNNLQQIETVMRVKVEQIKAQQGKESG